MLSMIDFLNSSLQIMVYFTQTVETHFYAAQRCQKKTFLIKERFATIQESILTMGGCSQYLQPTHHLSATDQCLTQCNAKETQHRWCNALQPSAELNCGHSLYYCKSSNAPESRERPPGRDCWRRPAQPRGGGWGWRATL